jgi:hypothetical protein
MKHHEDFLLTGFIGILQLHRYLTFSLEASGQQQSPQLKQAFQATCSAS